MTKAVFIGAGSVEFTRTLAADLLRLDGLEGLEIALHDIDSERLEIAEATVRRVGEAVGVRPNVSAHLDRAAALDGADYVINTIQVGGHAATLRDFDIPERYGLRQTIGDTLGIGGIFRTLRTVPPLLEIADDIARRAPDAWLLNYTNPMAMLCQAVVQGSPLRRVVGLCHSVQYTSRQLAELVGVPFEEVGFLGAGINHQAFILRLERDGEDLYPRLAARVAADPELQRRVRVDIYRRFGYFPTESSEHSAEYVPWYMRRDAEIERLRIPVREYVRRSEENLAEYERERRMAHGEEPFEVELEEILEYGALIIHSIETGTPRVIYGNVANDDLIPALPNGITVEVPCVVDRMGVTPTRVPDYPPQCAALNRTFLNVCDLTVRAALEHRRDHVYHAAMLDPNAAATLSLDAIRELCDELIAAHGLEPWFAEG